MVLESGRIPYDYDNELPLRARQSMAPSGEMIEQAQFVITAELRKLWKLNNSHELPEYKTYRDPRWAPDQPYEPQANGLTQRQRTNQGITKPITETRRALEFLFSRYADDSPYTSGEHHVDWIRAAYPESASGTVEVVGEPDDEVYPGWTRREAPSGRILDIDLDLLGGSGTYVDLDFGEIMFNPYPTPRRTRYAHAARIDGLKVVAGDLDGALLAGS